MTTTLTALFLLFTGPQPIDCTIAGVSLTFELRELYAEPSDINVELANDLTTLYLEKCNAD